MRVLCIFTFSLSTGQTYRIAGFSLRQARQALKRLIPGRYYVKHLEIQLRISLPPGHAER